MLLCCFHTRATRWQTTLPPPAVHTITIVLVSEKCRVKTPKVCPGVRGGSEAFGPGRIKIKRPSGIRGDHLRVGPRRGTEAGGGVRGSGGRPSTDDERSPLQLPQVDPHLCAVARLPHPNLENKEVWHTQITQNSWKMSPNSAAFTRTWLFKYQREIILNRNVQRQSCKFVIYSKRRSVLHHLFLNRVAVVPVLFWNNIFSHLRPGSVCLD